MFKDTEEELRRLEAELLAQEEEEEDWEQEDEEEVWQEPVEINALDEDLLNNRELDILLEDTQVFGEAGAYQNHANHYGTGSNHPARIYNSDRLEQTPEELSDELLEEPRRNTTSLVVLACLLAVGILCVAVWWLLRFRGVL